mmetsp:Transcript_11358/g.34759  ORF Transcript_11358/g.34759 Transcript_11358/m.34759 type:complete len:1181 (+) Transcript_11358:85-3627(+)
MPRLARLKDTLKGAMEVEEEELDTVVLDTREVEIQDGYRENESSKDRAGPEDESFTFYYTLNNLDEIEEDKIRSPLHEYSNFLWRLLIFPRGNGPDSKGSLSVYLECDGPTDERARSTHSWSKGIAFKLLVCSHGSKSRDICKDAKHTFTPRETDWGFNHLVTFDTLFSMDEDYIQDGELKLGVTMSLKTEYDSKKETGFNGFKNQGATCYMNSLLQVLYTLGDFRQSVYLMDLPEDMGDDKISFALQKVFYELQNGSTVVKTKKLTKSFGWDSADAFQQHDVQELNRILCSHLEDAMRKRNGRNKISELFEGKLLNYIECINVPYKSTREEPFFDLSLTIKGYSNLYESFDKYTEVEILDGDNKYQADGYNELQEARKGVKFLRLPPVLQLHLKRFEYDFVRDMNVKINDRFEFPAELDLNKYVENSNGSEIYLLHSVLVHVGDVHAGHYFVFIRPYAENKQWYKFDDENVTRVSERDAIEDNFGSPTPRKLSNAYMLQYIRKDSIHTILKQVKSEDVPKELEERIRLEAEEEENKRREMDTERFLFMEVTLVREELLRLYNGVDLIPMDKVDRPWLKKDWTVKNLREYLRGGLPVEKDRKLRIWTMTQRVNSTVRTDRLLTPDDDEKTLYELSRNMSSELQLFVQQVAGDADTLEEGEIIQFFKIYSPNPEPFLLYVGSMINHRDWAFMTVLQRLVEWPALYDCVVEAIKRNEAEYYQEVSPQDIRPMEMDKPFKDCDMGYGGDIIIIQIPYFTVSASENQAVAVKNAAVPLQGTRELSTVQEYFDYLLNRVSVEFRDIMKPNENGVKLELLKTDSYWEVRRRLAYFLSVCNDSGDGLAPNVELERIRLYAYDAVTQGPRPEAISIAQLNQREDTLERMLEIGSCPGLYGTAGTKIFWYEHVDYDVEEFEEKEEVRVTWRYDCGTSIPGISAPLEQQVKAQPELSVPPNSQVKAHPELSDDMRQWLPQWMRTKTLPILVPYDTSTYADVIQETRTKLGIPRDLPLRILEVKSSVISRIIDPSELVTRGYHRRANPVQPDSELRIEPNFTDGFEKRDSEKSCENLLIPVLHIPNNNSDVRRSYFGDPFLLPVSADGEKVSVVRERIRRKIRVPEEEFRGWRLAEVTSSNLAFLDDTDGIWYPKQASSEEVSLAIEHKRKVPPKRTYGLMKYDKPLIIKS